MSQVGQNFGENLKDDPLSNGDKVFESNIPN